MSRAKATEVSSPISLFPFIGVLLSTMGALLVVLIAVSRSAHDAALRELEARKVVASADDQNDDRQHLNEVNQYVAKLNDVRAEAEKRLRDDQLRLSHIEDHTRRLKEKLQSLQYSVNELVALEGDHYDDHKQAQREIERLAQIIASTRETIAALQDESKSKRRSYAIIPYDGPHGTQRRPIYIECRANEVVLQPEGIHLTPEDFRQPLGAGNPLASALRAAREYIVRQEGVGISNRETQPYPLILVRPQGILAYYRVRQAIESWDTDFGYELVDDDWKLEFPSANPMLAELEQQAVAHSRTRQQMLVAAAPREFGARNIGGGGSFDEEDEGEFEEGDGEFSDVRGGGLESRRGYGGGGNESGAGGYGRSHAVDTSPNGERGAYFGEGGPYGGGEGSGSRAAGNGNNGPGGNAANGPVGAPGTGSGAAGGTGGGSPGSTSATGSTGPGGSSGAGGSAAGMPAMSGQEQGRSLNVVAGNGSADSSNSRGAAPPLSASATGSSLASGVGEAPLSAFDRSAGSPINVGAQSSRSQASSDDPPERVPLDMQMNVQQRIPAHSRGQNWAIKGKGPTSVPIRRTIRITVQEDRLALLSDTPSAPRDPAGQEIPLTGSTAAKLDDLVRAVQGRVHEWGLAGTGMYWRPVLLLEVDPGGQARADDLARMLKNSGIEVRNEATAARPAEGAPSATR